MTFLCSCEFIFNFFAYQPFRSFFFMKFCVAQTFWVERYLEVLQLFGSKLVDIHDRKTHRKNDDDYFINEGDNGDFMKKVLLAMYLGAQG